MDVVKFIKFLKTKVERERELISDSLVDGRISKEDYEKSVGKASGLKMCLDLIRESSKNLEDNDD